MRDRIRTALQALAPARAVFGEAAARGEPVYLVGGALRDLALGLDPVDVDFVSPNPYELACSLADRAGKRVVSLGKEAAPTYRVPLDAAVLDFTALQGGGIEADLLRRDFTLNAIGYDPRTQDILDPADGFGDLKTGLIRLVSERALEDDPVRVLRAYRFLAQLPGFRLHPGTERLLGSRSGALVDAPSERLHLELERLFEGDAAGRACRAMADSGVLFLLFPELKRLDGLAQNDYHHADVLRHSLEALEEFDGPPRWTERLGLPGFGPRQKEILRLSLLLHDLGKADTRTVGEDGRVHFYGHSKPSAERAADILRRLRFPNAVAEQVAALCLHHLRPLALLKTSPRKTAVRRLIHSLGDLLPLLLALSFADKSAARGRNRRENLEELGVLIREVLDVAAREGEEIRHLPKFVDGMEALDILGLHRPGPDLGRALDALLERQVEGAVSTREGAVAFLREWRDRHFPPKSR
ncbi:MAG: HD domain-containing protein [Acidobacteriota bacterium]